MSLDDRLEAATKARKEAYHGWFARLRTCEHAAYTTALRSDCRVEEASVGALYWDWQTRRVMLLDPRRGAPCPLGDLPVRYLIGCVDTGLMTTFIEALMDNMNLGCCNQTE